jgi:hypothetical protein
MENFTPNSHRSKEQSVLPEKKAKKVVSGNVQTKKKNEIRKFTDIFVAGDLASVGDYLLYDIVVPNVKRLIEDISVSGIRMFLHGKDGAKSSGSSYGMPKISYRSYSDSDRRDPRSGGRDDYRARSRFDYDDLVFDSRGDAEVVLTQMDEMLDRYKVVSVLDMYDAAGVTPPYTADKYGWTDLHDAKIVPVRNGYVIKLPKAFPLD